MLRIKKKNKKHTQIMNWWCSLAVLFCILVAKTSAEGDEEEEGEPPGYLCDLTELLGFEPPASVATACAPFEHQAAECDEVKQCAEFLLRQRANGVRSVRRGPDQQLIMYNASRAVHWFAKVLCSCDAESWCFQRLFQGENLQRWYLPYHKPELTKWFSDADNVQHCKRGQFKWRTSHWSDQSFVPSPPPSSSSSKKVARERQVDADDCDRVFRFWGANLPWWVFRGSFAPDD
jgi:hypothetical protein